MSTTKAILASEDGNGGQWKLAKIIKGCNKAMSNRENMSMCIVAVSVNLMSDVTG